MHQSQRPSKESGPGDGSNVGEERQSLAQRLFRSPGLRMIAGAVVIGWISLAWLDYVGGPEALRERFGLGAAAVLVPLEAFASLSIFPGEFIAVALGMLYGFWLGSFFIWLGWMLTAYMQYFMVRRVAEDFASEFERLPAWIQRFPVGHPVFLIVGRWVPFGGHLVNPAAGAFKVPLWRYTWCSAIGIGAGSFLFGAAGSGLVLL